MCLSIEINENGNECLMIYRCIRSYSCSSGLSSRLWRGSYVFLELSYPFYFIRKNLFLRVPLCIRIAFTLNDSLSRKGMSTRLVSTSLSCALYSSRLVIGKVG
jgi:hypothetical protein